MDRHHVPLVGGDDGESAVFALDEDGGTGDGLCRLACRYRGREVSVAATDFFEALGLIRQTLEGDGLIPRCYGASLDVWPSGMGRDMGAGLKAYRLVLGRPARTADLVGVFATGPDVVPATVADQTAVFERWLQSLRP